LSDRFLVKESEGLIVIGSGTAPGAGLALRAPSAKEAMKATAIRASSQGRDMVAPLSPRYRRVVAKVGTNVLTAGGDRLDLEVMASLVGQVARLRQQGVQVAIVSSGAIAAGRHRLGVKGEARDVPQRQVLAAVGQPDLMYSYQQLFAWHGITVAQTLLSRRDLSDRQGYLNARNTLMALLQLGVVPIVNENDVVAVEEIEGAAIGDNDTLSALVANLVDADLLVILTDTDGLYTADPYLDPQAQLIRRVERIDAEVERLAGASHGPGRGGMITKVQAARLATASGTHVVIANGHSRDVLVRVVAGGGGGHPLPTSHRPSGEPQAVDALRPLLARSHRHR